MSHAAEVQNFVTSSRSAFDTVGDKERECRRKFFDRPWMLAADAFAIGDQAERSRRYRNTGEPGDMFGRSPNDLRVQRPLRRHQYVPDLFRVAAVQKVRALAAKFFADGGFDRSIYNHRLLGRADRSVIETSAHQNIADGLFDVRGAFDENRHISRPDAERRLAR